jgi:hypothetical protein
VFDGLGNRGPQNAYEELERGFQGEHTELSRVRLPRTYTAAGLVAGSAEFLGPYEETGWGSQEQPSPPYIAWSVWLLAMGMALIA